MAAAAATTMDRAEANANASVLVIEDDPTSRLLVAAALEGHVGRVHEAENGLIGVQALEGQPFDLAIVDLDMPVMDGFAVIERARTEPDTKHMPIIVITGRDDVLAIERAFALGATSFICKPINWAVFRHQVGYVLQVAKAERDARYAKDHAEMLAQLRQRALVAIAHVIRSVADGEPSASVENFTLPGGDEPALRAGVREVLWRVKRADVLLSGDSEFDPQPVEATALVQDVSEQVAAMLGAKTAARITVDVPPLQLHCDRRLAGEALSEVLINALTHSPEGQQVHIAAVHAPPDRIRFEIVDHGPGVPEHVLDRVFGRLQDSGAPGETSHLGLGLAMARAIVARHGGHLGIMSEPDVGTEAFLSFPSVQARHGKESLKQMLQMSRIDLRESGHTPVT
jgi:two-component system sensor histidine kinase/response regulator